MARLDQLEPEVAQDKTDEQEIGELLENKENEEQLETKALRVILDQ